MNDLKALMERPECCWGYIDELRMALAAACKERDELKKELHEAKSELLKYREAEQAGRLVVLPCKVGDSIYIPDLEKKIPVKVRVQGISMSVSGRTILHFGGYPVECAWGDGCGKDWFFTREEAEAALAQKGGTHEADSV